MPTPQTRTTVHFARDTRVIVVDGEFHIERRVRGDGDIKVTMPHDWKSGSVIFGRRVKYVEPPRSIRKQRRRAARRRTVNIHVHLGSVAGLRVRIVPVTVSVPLGCRTEVVRAA